MNQRPWLKSVMVSGKASFFGASGEGEPGARFELSPDLTCIIGGSMTGKSTLLDGLRIYVGAPLPQESGVKVHVEARGKDRFLGGSAEVVLDCPGQDPTAAPHEQWPAVFYTQTELQRLAQNPDAVEDILARLVASKTQDITARGKRLEVFDKELVRAASRLAKLGDDLADAEQAFHRSQRAATELAAFSDAGVENLNRVSSDLRRWRESTKAANELSGDMDSLLESAAAVQLPEVDDDLAGVLLVSGVVEGEADLRARWDRVRSLLISAKDELGATNAVIKSITYALEVHGSTVRVQVDRDLAARGLDGARINQLQELTGQSSLLESYEAHLNELRYTLVCRALVPAGTERKVVENSHARVIEAVHSQFDGRIEARRLDEGRNDALDLFLRETESESHDGGRRSTTTPDFARKTGRRSVGWTSE